MWLLIIILTLLFLCTISPLNVDVATFAIEYFKYRNVGMICLLVCGKDDFWTLHFAKSASNKLMAVSQVKMDLISSENNIFQCLKYNLHSIGVLLDGNCKEANEVMFLASENLSYSAQHKWLIIDNEPSIFAYDNASELNRNNNLIFNDAGTVKKVLNKLNLSVDADITVAYSGNDAHYTLYEVYNFGKIQGGHLIVNNIGYWDMTNGLNLLLDLNEYKYYRRWDFDNWMMRMILVISPAPKNFDINSLSSQKPIPGMATITHTSGAILCLIADVHNFRFKHTITDRWIGSFEKNATKVVTNSLYYREQDISPIVRLLPSIQEKIDALAVPMLMFETRFYYRIPTTGPGKFENKFLLPLSPVVWWCIVGVSSVFSLLLLLSARLEQRPSSVEYAILSVIALICQQFYVDNGDATARRISTARQVLILVNGLSCVLIYNYYTSSVVSWLLNGPPPSINSLQELLESPLELIFEDVGYTRSWLQTPTYYFNKRNALIEDKLRQKKVFNKKKGEPLLETLVDGIKLVQNGGYAYHTEVNSANALISRTFSQAELCELGSLQVAEKTPVFTCMPKDSPYKEFITWSLMRLLERGFISCIQARTAATEVKCEGSSPRALALGGAAPAFILLASGYLLATLIMLIERTIYKKKNKNY